MPRSSTTPTTATPGAARSLLAATAALASTAAVVVVAPASAARFAPRSPAAAPAARVSPRSSASSSSSVEPGDGDGAAAAADITASRNTRLLRQLQRSSDPSSRLHWRNALVSANLLLARSVAARLQSPQHASFDDMVQVACLGLIRAVEAFDPSRRVSLSSFAVPYMRGALLHELRDRQAPVRIPRPLWELRQQVGRLQESRRQRGEAPLTQRGLTRRLGCNEEQLLEIETLGRVTTPRSLDAPAGPSWEGEIGATLLERLADPRSLQHPGDSEDGEDQEAEAAMRSWLKARLNDLDPMRRELLEGRLNLGCTWVELGQRLGIHPRMAQRRCDATLAELRREAAAWQAGQQIPFPTDPNLSAAGPTGRS